MPGTHRIRYVFGPFAYEPAERRLTREGEVVEVSPKGLDLLESLIRRPGRLVTKDDLMEEVWPEAIVEENALSVQISKLRTALGETAREATYIETVPRAGYRFAAPVRAIGDAERSPSREEHLPSQLPTARRRTASPSRGIIAALAVTGIGILVASSMLLARSEEDAGAEIQSIAVLPLVSVGELPDAHLGVALADALITQISAVGGLVVRPISAVERYGGDVEPLVAGHALRVDAVLEGRIEAVGGDLRITARLLATGDGSEAWAAAYEVAEMEGLLEVQDDIVRQIIRALAVDLDAAEADLLSQRRAQTSAANEAYLRGRARAMRRTGADLRRSLADYRQAVQIEPTFALGYASIASIYVLLVWYDGMPPSEAMPRAAAAAEAARRLDPALPEALIPSAHVAWLYDRDLTLAEAYFREAAQRAPTLASAHHHLGEFLALTGRFEEGVDHLERARILDPVSPIIAVDAATAYLFNGHPDEAIRRYRAVIELHPDFALAWLFLGVALRSVERPEDAAAAIERAIELGGPVPIWQAVAAGAYGEAGRLEQARSMVDELRRLSDERFVSPVHLAIIFEVLGERDRAVEYLELAIRMHDPMWIYIGLYPQLESLRADPRFGPIRRTLAQRR